MFELFTSTQKSIAIRFEDDEYAYLSAIMAERRQGSGTRRFPTRASALRHALKKGSEAIEPDDHATRIEVPEDLPPADYAWIMPGETLWPVQMPKATRSALAEAARQKGVTPRQILRAAIRRAMGA
ncbi:hypothetical protein [Chachezhania sediminis]|uniref:hypothetical protein n=1 Tax=Chachezhania sediminis TaxID=2599291 RepID=UPI00131C14F4|nr:hypothetical protein [Chachezhania sediminis]